MRQSLRASLDRLRPAQAVAIAMVLSAVLLSLAWQSPRPLIVDLGNTPDSLYIGNFHDPEPPAPRPVFRWSAGQSTVAFPGAGIGNWRLDLTFSTGRDGRTPAPSVELYNAADSSKLAALAPTQPDFTRYDVPIGISAASTGDLVLQISTSPTFKPAGDDRDLGIAVDSVVLFPAGPVIPAPWVFLALVGVVGCVALALGQAGGARTALAGGALTGVLIAGIVAWQRLWITPFSTYLLLMAGLLALGAVLARAIVARYGTDPAGPHGETSTPASQATQFVLAALLVALIGYGLVAFGMAISTAFNQPRAVDFRVHWDAARLIAQGVPLYDPAEIEENAFGPLYKYPPLFAGLIRPLTMFGFDTARNLWRGLDVAMLAAAVWVIVASFARLPMDAGATMRRARLSLRDFASPAAVGLIFLGLVFRPAIDAINYGQLDPAILLLLALTLAALRSGKPVLAGIPLALAAALKIYPGVLVLYLLWKREWKAAASFVAAFLGLGVLGMVLTGPRDTITYFTQVLPASGGSTAWVENQTISGFVARLLTDSLRLEPFPGSPAGPALMLNLLTYFAAVAVLGLTLWLARGPRRLRAGHDVASPFGSEPTTAERTGPAYALGFGAMLTASIVVLPASWLHYYTVLLLPLALALYALQEEGWHLRVAEPRRVLLAVMLLGLGGALLAFENIWIVFNRVNMGGIWKLVLSYKLYGGVALWGALVLLLAASRARWAGPGQEPRNVTAGADRMAVLAAPEDALSRTGPL